MNAQPRCASHKDTRFFPEGCQVCRRIKLEGTIVRKTVRALLAAGYALKTDANEDMAWSVTFADIVKELMEVDDERLLAQHDNTQTSWVYFVYGNDGWDVISDYTTDLEDVLKAVTDYSMRMGGQS